MRGLNGTLMEHNQFDIRKYKIQTVDLNKSENNSKQTTKIILTIFSKYWILLLGEPFSNLFWHTRWYRIDTFFNKHPTVAYRAVQAGKSLNISSELIVAAWRLIMTTFNNCAFLSFRWADSRSRQTSDYATSCNCYSLIISYIPLFIC